MRNFSHFHRCLLNHPLTRWSLLKNFSYLWKFFLQFHDRGGPGSWRRPQCWEIFKISLQLFFHSFFSVMPRSSSSCFSETKFFYIPDKHLALFFAFCCVFCPFLLLFQLQGIWSSLSRRFTPRHAPTRLPCASNSFSALKLKIENNYQLFVIFPSIVFVQVVFFYRKVGTDFQFLSLSPIIAFCPDFLQTCPAPRQVGGHSP